MKILIIGCRGFIGSHLCEYLLEKGYEVVGCDIMPADKTDFAYYQLNDISTDLEQIFTSHIIDFCINTAGAANVYNSILYPLNDFESNVFAVAKILDVIRKLHPICKYIHLSSAAVYGNPSQLPIKESAELLPISPYGYHKLISEIICKEYFELYKIPMVIIRPFSIYGNRLSKQLFWDICDKLKKSDSIELFGTGLESRDFIHISDFVSLLESVIQKSDFEFKIYNAASGKQIYIKEIVQIFEQYFNGTKEINFNCQTKAGDPIHWEASITAISRLGFSPKAILAKSVTDYIKWFKDLQN